MERRYTTSDAAAIIGISPKTLRNILSKQRRGRSSNHKYLAYEYVGNRTVFRASVLEAWIEAEHQLGLKKYERRRKLTTQNDPPRYVKLEDWDGHGHRCEYCGYVTTWKYLLKNHLARRKETGRCPVPMATKKVDPVRGPRRSTGKPKAKKPSGRVRPRKPRRKPKKRKVKAKPKPKRGSGRRKTKSLGLIEGWDMFDGT